MPIVAYRIVKPQHETSAFTGVGARLYGGRWNSKGRAVVYVAGSKSLAAMEMLVHLGAEDVLRRYRVAEVQIAESDVADLTIKELPAGWREELAPAATKVIGDAWLIANATVALRLPSVIIPGERNLLLNPAHPNFPNATIGPFEDFDYDPRLLKSIPVKT